MTDGRTVWVKDGRVVIQEEPGAMPFRLPPKKRRLPPLGAHVERCRLSTETYRAWWHRPGTAEKVRQHLHRVTSFDAPEVVLRYVEADGGSPDQFTALRAMTLADVRIYDSMVQQVQRDLNEVRAPRVVIRERLLAALGRGGSHVGGV